MMTKLRFYSIWLVALGIQCLYGDVLVQVHDPGSQGATDRVLWSAAGAEGSMPGAAFSINSLRSVGVRAQMPDGQAAVTAVCPQTVCGWNGTGFPSGDSLLWTSTDTAGWVTFTLPAGVGNAGAYIQPNAPGTFTAQIRALHDGAVIGEFSAPSDSVGNAAYLGVIDQSGPNITAVALRISQCPANCSDFAVGTMYFDPGPVKVTVTPNTLTFRNQEVNTTSAAQSVTVTNSGAVPFSPNIQTDDGQFLQTNNCARQLASGASCTISASFRPASPFGFGANLTIGTGAPTVKLYGDAIKTRYSGTLTTNDPADRIAWVLEPYNVSANSVEIQFCISQSLTWRKTAFVQYGNNSETRMSVSDDAKCLSSDFDPKTLHQMQVWKAGFLGIMKWVGTISMTTHPFIPNGEDDYHPLPGGYRLTLTWTKD